jgi:hypothetical protein
MCGVCVLACVRVCVCDSVCRGRGERVCVHCVGLYVCVQCMCVQCVYSVCVCVCHCDGVCAHHVCVRIICVCVCVWERERERDIERTVNITKQFLLEGHKTS